MQNYHYPSTIRANSNAARSLIFSIYDQSGLIKSVSDSMADALDKKNTLCDKTEVVCDTAKTILSNLKANETVSDSELICVITLPLPNTFNDTQNHNWSSQKSLLGDILGTAATANIADTSFTEGLGMAAGAYIGNQLGGGTGLGGVGGAIAGALGGLAIGSKVRNANISADSLLSNMASRTGQRKPIIDPGYFQNYSGSTTRTFNLKYDFVPNNIEEAESILMIITKFKQYSSPSQITATPMLNAPFNFKISNDNSYLNVLTAIDTVVLTSISVDYGADGAMEMFGDGMPKHITLSLSFAENRLRTAEDYSTKPDTTSLGTY